MDHSEAKVVQKKEEQRFVIEVGDNMAYLEYMEQERLIVFPHTEVPKELEGYGYGKMLAEAALSWAQSTEKRIVPTCPFLASYIRRHPEYRPMVAKGFII